MTFTHFSKCFSLKIPATYPKSFLSANCEASYQAAAFCWQVEKSRRILAKFCL